MAGERDCVKKRSATSATGLSHKFGKDKMIGIIALRLDRYTHKHMAVKSRRRPFG
jgi:hypothetical protein